MKFVVTINDVLNGQELSGILKQLAKEIEFTQFGPEADILQPIDLADQTGNNVGEAFFTKRYDL